jgi:hypothetical protein
MLRRDTRVGVVINSCDVFNVEYGELSYKWI